jgi:hypothetical protein
MFIRQEQTEDKPLHSYKTGNIYNYHLAHTHTHTRAYACNTNWNLRTVSGLPITCSDTLYASLTVAHF